MKSKYCFVRSMSAFNRDSVVYVCYVGTSQREQAKLELIRCYAADCGIYFRPWSMNVDTTLMNLANSLFGGSLLSRTRLRTAHVSVNELYRLIIEDGFTAYENNLHHPRAFFHSLSAISPAFRFSQSRKICHTACPEVKRKYLSRSSSDEVVQVSIALCLILCLFLCSMILSGIESSLY